MTPRKRWEEIEKKYFPFYTSDPKAISYEDVEWLLSQAKRVEELEKTLKALKIDNPYQIPENLYSEWREAHNRVIEAALQGEGKRS